MDTAIGSPISLKFSDTKETIQGFFVGSESPSYIIVRLPTDIDGTAWQPGQAVSASYISFGNAYSIETSVLYFLSKFQLLFLSYPESYQKKPLRKESRIHCRIPATASIEQRALKGLVTDISNNGCQFIVRIPTTFKLYRVSVLTDINLSLSLFGKADSALLKGKVRNTNIDEFKIVLGVEFDTLQEPFSHRLKGFIEELEDLQ